MESNQEQIQQPQESIPDILANRYDLDYILGALSAENEMVIEVGNLLEEFDESFDEQKAITEARSSIRGVLVDHTASLKSQARRDIGTPPGEETALESPNAYIKRNSLDSRFRPDLRQAHTETLQASRARLHDSIDQVAFSQYDTEIEDEALLESVRAYRKEKREEVISYGKAISDVCLVVRASESEEFTDLGDSHKGIEYLDEEVLKMVQRMGAIVVSIEGGYEEQEPLITANLINLRRVLKEFRNLESYAARYAAEAHTDSLKDHLESQLTQDIEGLKEAELETLEIELQEAYDKIAAKDPQYKPSQADLIVVEEDKKPKDKRRTFNKEVHKKTTEEVVLPNPFPWIEENELGFGIVRHNGEVILRCRAILPELVPISDKLRQECDTAKTFNGMWEVVQDKTLTNPRGTHRNISKAADPSNPLLEGFVVLKYGNLEANAKRVYFIKTICSKFDDIARFVTSRGLNADTNILALIAETDKTNQEDVYTKGFGVGRAEARANGVGST